MNNFMNETKSKQNKTAKRFKFINKYFVVPFYRLNILPLLLIGRIIVLLYTIGRKSGKTRITPLEFRRYNDKILLFSARGKFGDWYKNILANPNDVRIKIGFKKYNPSVKVSSYEEKKEILTWYINTYPKSAKSLFGYQKNKDIITDELLKPITEFIEIFQLNIK